MKSYKITAGQKNSLMKPQKYNGMEFNSLQDANGDWFIWELEAEFCRQNFGWALVEAPYIEPEYTPQPGDLTYNG